MDVAYLDALHLVALTGSILGHEPQVRDVGLLESALARPRTTVMGTDAYPTLDLKAAALLDSVVNNYAFVDGNKRAGLVAVFVFYRLNGVDFDAPHEPLYELILSVADGSLRDVEKIAEALGSWCRPAGAC
jgi:death-on-curing protein